MVSALSVLLAGITGTFLAVLLTRWDFPLKRVCQVLALVPLALPPLIGVRAFFLLFGPGMVFPRLVSELFGTDQIAFSLYGLSGVLLVHTVTMYPYFYLSVTAALSNTDDSLEEAARSLGASGFQTWSRVLLPMLTPALVAGGLLTFISSMASYTAPAIFGFENVLTRQIVIARDLNEMRLAAVGAVVLAAFSIVFLILIRLYEQRRVYRTQSKGGARKRRRTTSGVGKAIAFAAALVSIVFLLLPIAVVVLFAFSVDSSWKEALPSAYTLQNFAAIYSDRDSWVSIKNSLEMSAIAVAAAIPFAVAGAYVISRRNFRGKTLMDIAMMLPWALPGTVVAVSLIVRFNQPSVFSLQTVLVNTFAIVPLAYFVRFSPLIFRSSAAALSQLGVNLEEASRSLGAGWTATFLYIVLPLVSRGILAGALLAFVDGVGEFVASVLLTNTDTTTMSVVINDKLYRGNFGTGAALGVIQIILVFAVVIVVRRIEDRDSWSSPAAS